MTRERLDTALTTRRDLTAQGGCPDVDVPAALLLDMSDEQFNALFPAWQHVAADIWQAASTTDEVLQAS